MRPHPLRNGQVLRSEALAAMGSKHAGFLRAGRRALLEALLRCGRATADDVRAAVPLPAGASPRAFGAVPGGLAKAGLIAPAGYRPSSRPEAHARPIQVWALLSADAARAWLLANPPLVLPAAAQLSLFPTGSEVAR